MRDYAFAMRDAIPEFFKMQDNLRSDIYTYELGMELLYKVAVFAEAKEHFTPNGN